MQSARFAVRAFAGWPLQSRVARALSTQQPWSAGPSYCSSAEGETDHSGDADAIREQILEAALAQVPRSGWSRESLLAGVRSLGLSPAALGLLPRAEASLVEYFVRQCNRRLEAELASMTPQLAGLRVTQRVHTAVRRRLEMLAPVMDSWPQALVLLARPSSAPVAAQLLYELVDDIWYAAGDTSTDASWYSKRALLAGVYASTELYMLTDYSPGYQDTWDALERRLADVLTVGRMASGVGSGMQALAAAGAHALRTALPGAPASSWQQEPQAGQASEEQQAQQGADVADSSEHATVSKTAARPAPAQPATKA